MRSNFNRLTYFDPKRGQSHLNAETAERIWHFQAVHHDIWDRDFPSPPALVTVQHGGKAVEALLKDQNESPGV